MGKGGEGLNLPQFKCSYTVYFCKKVGLTRIHTLHPTPSRRNTEYRVLVHCMVQSEIHVTLINLDAIARSEICPCIILFVYSRIFHSDGEVTNFRCLSYFTNSFTIKKWVFGCSWYYNERHQYKVYKYTYICNFKTWIKLTMDSNIHEHVLWWFKDLIRQ